MSTERGYATWSGLPLEAFYEPKDGAQGEVPVELGRPGAYPFTRGIFPGGYRDKPWITRNLTGLLSPQASNERLRFLAERGQTGFAVVPDVPTLLGIDSDHPMARASVGTGGVPLSSVADMEALFDGLPLDVTTSSFSVCGIAASVLMAQYVVAAQRRGVPRELIRGSVQNDPLQARFCCCDAGTRLDLALRLCIDTVEFSARQLPNWHALSVNAYDLRESGINAVQEIAFGLAIAFTYIGELCRRGLHVDDFAHRMLLICGVHIDIFEEAAKFRAARRIWARTLKERFGAGRDKSMTLKVAAHTCGSSLTRQEPVNNVVRGAYEALAAVLGGVQALDLSCYDEGAALPSETAATVALKTQQILATETGVINTADPLGGSFLIETLTDRIEQGALALLREIDEKGGMVRMAESGWFAHQLSGASQHLQDEIDTGRKKVVGVNVFATPGEYEKLLPIEHAHLEPCAEQAERLRSFKEQREPGRAWATLDALNAAAKRANENLFPHILSATDAGATLGEIIGAMRMAYGQKYDPFEMIECPWEVR